jgi:hypothetical protein
METLYGNSNTSRPGKQWHSRAFIDCKELLLDWHERANFVVLRVALWVCNGGYAVQNLAGLLAILNEVL